MTELAEVFEQHGPQYRAQFGDKMLPSHRQAMRAIERCRTPALGGHIYTCDACAETQYLYHSCRNRHCPKCQKDKAYLWLEKQRTKKPMTKLVDEALDEYFNRRQVS